MAGRSAVRLARLVRDQEVGGSNPLAPTKKKEKKLPIEASPLPMRVRM